MGVCVFTDFCLSKKIGDALNRNLMQKFAFRILTQNIVIFPQDMGFVFCCDLLKFKINHASLSQGLLHRRCLQSFEFYIGRSVRL